MVGKRAQAEQISKWLGSLGQIGEPPPFFYVAEAARILGCSFIDLEYHPDKFELMGQAFTLQWGRTDGELQRELNPEYVKKRKALEAKIAEAQKRGR